MGWLSLLWLVVVFGAFYLALPAAALGDFRPGIWPRRIVEGFVSTAFVLQFTIVILGAFGIALPGIVLSCFGSFLLMVAIRRRPWWLRSAFWKESAVRLIQTRLGECAARLLQSAAAATPRLGKQSAPLAILLASYFLSGAWFAAGNVRFLDIDNYARALSLGVLSWGEPWRIDTTVPILLPLQFLSALSAPDVIRLSGPLISVLLVLAVAFLVFEYTGSEKAALVGCGLSMLAPTWRGGTGGSEIGSAELAATFAVLSFGLLWHSRTQALIAAAVAVSISASPSMTSTVLTGLACAILGVASHYVAQIFPQPWRLRPAAIAATVVLLAWRVPAATPDGPHQYEAAAKACQELVRTLNRNTWLVVSPAEERPFVYGSGWHLPLAEMTEQFSINQVRDPAFRFPYPVQHVFVFVERHPLRPSSAAGVDATQMARAALQLKVSRILAAYRESHTDLELVYSSDHFSVIRLPGTLAALRPKTELEESAKRADEGVRRTP